MTMKLHKWQNEALNEVFDKKKIIIEVATGAGKTFFTVEFLKRINKKNYKTLIVSPKLVILDNWDKELKKYFSFTDIGYYYSEIKEYAKITLTTTKSINNINLDVFDILIIDEIHNCFTPSWRNIYKKKWKYMIGLSATIKKDNHKHWKFLKYFGYNVYSYNIEKAINDEILSKFILRNYYVLLDPKTKDNYDYLTEKINNIIRIAGDYYSALNNPKYKLSLLKYLNLRKKIIYHYKKKFDVLKKVIKQHLNNKIIIFNESNEVAMGIYLEMLDLDINARVANSNYTKAEINQILSDFEKGKFNVLITTRMFDEGYNLPSLDVAIIFSGESSDRQFIQRLGRVLRKKNTDAYVYQIYVKDTMEEAYVKKRNELMKNTASKIQTEQY